MMQFLETGEQLQRETEEEQLYLYGDAVAIPTYLRIGEELWV